MNPEDYTVGELLQMAVKGPMKKAARRTLLRNGIKIVGDRMLVANDHPGLEKMYKGTHWAGGGWASRFAKLPGAKAMPASDFGDGIIVPSISLPITPP